MLIDWKNLRGEKHTNMWRQNLITHHRGRTLPACKRNQTILAILTDCKHEKKNKIEIMRKNSDDENSKGNTWFFSYT